MDAETRAAIGAKAAEYILDNETLAKPPSWDRDLITAVIFAAWDCGYAAASDALDAAEQSENTSITAEIRVRAELAKVKGLLEQAEDRAAALEQELDVIVHQRDKARNQLVRTAALVNENERLRAAAASMLLDHNDSCGSCDAMLDALAAAGGEGECKHIAPCGGPGCHHFIRAIHCDCGRMLPGYGPYEVSAAPPEGERGEPEP